MFLGQPICQIAYMVPDIRVAAARHSKLFGSGPFFVLENVEFGRVTHGGKDTYLHHSAAMGQWGNMQVEFLQVNNPRAADLAPIFPIAGKSGLHHIALMVENLAQSVAHFEAAGFPEVMRATVPSMKLEAVFVDTVESYGHYLELYAAVPALVSFNNIVKSAAAGFDGTNPVRQGTVP